MNELSLFNDMLENYRPDDLEGIELAPNHKQGLYVANPILLGAGAIGYGEAVHRGMDVAKVGAVVVGPVMSHGSAGVNPPRIAHINGGAIINHGLQNRGVSAAIRRYGSLWPTLGSPVVVQVADSQEKPLQNVIRRLMDALSRGVEISAIELLLAQDTDVQQIERLLQIVERESEVPLLVKMPLARAVELAPIVVDAGADALVVAQPLQGAAYTGNVDDPSGVLVSGATIGPLAFAPMLHVLHEVAGLSLPTVLIAAGGIHAIDHVKQALAVGAKAVQIDSAVWVEPGLPARLVDELR